MKVNFTLSNALLELGRFHEAVLVLREAQLHAERAKSERAPAPDAFSPPDGLCTPDIAVAEITIHLADALAFTGRADEAMALLNSAIVFSPNPDAYVRLARLHERKGDFVRAAEHWRAAGEDYAPLANPDARMRLVADDLGAAYELREQDLDAANFDPDEFEHHLDFPFSELDPDTPEPVVTPTGRAISNAEAAYALDPTAHYPLTLLSEICNFLHLPLQRLSYADQAASLAASRLADAPPRDPAESDLLLSSLLSAVVAYCEAGRHEDALIYSSAAHSSYPDSHPAALVHASALSVLERPASLAASRLALIYNVLKFRVMR